MKKLSSLFALVLSVTGFVPRHATLIRTVMMAAAFIFSLYLLNASVLYPVTALSFYLISTAAYIGFIYLVLPQHGLRHWFMQAFGGEEKGYLAYEATLGFLFFLNGSSIGCVSLAFSNSLPLPITAEAVRSIAAVLFVTGWEIKLWSAKVVGVDIYYWKDMFCGRRIGPFVAEGPYKYVSNPMYGLGQLQSYATALWYLSLPGLVAALVNQLLVFSFYHFQEKSFIQRTYFKRSEVPGHG